MMKSRLGRRRPWVDVLFLWKVVNESSEEWRPGVFLLLTGALHASYSRIYMDGNGNIANNSASWYGGEGGHNR